MNTSVESPKGSRPRKTSDTVKIAMISAATAVLTTLVTAGVTVFQSMRAAEKSAAEAKSSAENASQAAASAKRSEESVSRVARADAALSATKCPTAITRDGLPLLKPFSDQFESDNPSSRELLNIQGRGCLVNSWILGYYFQNVAGGRNYTISINIDGYEFIYPQTPEQHTVAYGQNAAGDNTGVLVLPQLAFEKSLRIAYYYPGGHKEVAAYALVAYQSD